jgi:hypothetical protein
VAIRVNTKNAITTPRHRPRKEVAAVFTAYPQSIREKFFALRALIFEPQRRGEMEEIFKWAEPAYLANETQSGSTIRLRFEVNRAIVLDASAALPVKILRPCIRAAMTYHLHKRKCQHGR